MSDILFTSDTHFWHKNIVHIGDGRPWPDSDTMTEALVENWNNTVGKTDRIYHLGDFSFGNRDQTLSVLQRLNGHKHLLRGNHDSTLDTVVRQNPHLVESYDHYKEIKVAGQRLVLFHYPIVSWHDVHHGSWHLHGHCHGQLRFDNGPMMDVGVDVTDYRPISYDEVAAKLSVIEPIYRDHHRRSDP